MAEALLRHYAGDRFEAHSAGLEPKDIHTLTRRVMQEKDLNLHGQYPKDVREYLGKLHFAYLIIVCGDAEQKCPTIFPGVMARLFWEFEDPAAHVGTDEEKLQKFRDVRDQIDRRIREWLEEQGIEITA
jgi:arsenate reductase